MWWIIVAFMAGICVPFLALLGIIAWATRDLMPENAEPHETLGADSWPSPWLAADNSKKEKP